MNSGRVPAKNLPIPSAESRSTLQSAMHHFNPCVYTNLLMLRFETFRNRHGASQYFRYDRLTRGDNLFKQKL